MSVINNVLKDLESRESQFAPIEIKTGGKQLSSRRDLRPLWLGMLFLLVLVVVAGWSYQQGYLETIGIAASTGPSGQIAHENEPASDAAKNIEPAARVAVEPAAADESAESAVVEQGFVTDQMIGNQIIGLQIRESEVEMEMGFVLREKVVAYLRERGENNFGYHLREVESQIVAPAISDNPWIRELEINSSPTGVDINFETVPDILVETRQGLVDGEPVWAITLRKAVQPVQPVAAVAVAEPAVETLKAEVNTQQPGQAGEPAEVTDSAPPSSDAAAQPAQQVRVDIKSTNPNAKLQNQLDYAVELINSGRAGEAETLLQGLLTGVEDYNARKHLLVLYARQNRADRYLGLLRESIVGYPEDALFRTEYARALFQRSDYREVIRIFTGSDTLDADQQALLAASHQRLDQHEDAVRHYRLALALDDGNARNWIALGVSQEHTAALEDALVSYRQAAALGGLNARLRAFIDKRSNTLRRVLN